MSHNDHILEVAKGAARSSAEIILKALDHPRNVDYKGKTNLVTQTDRDSELNLISIISRKFPDHSILGEESGKSKTGSPFLWVIDPLDGTTNFVHNLPIFAVSIGLQYNEETSYQ